MGKKKLMRFAENHTLNHVVEPTRAQLSSNQFEWNGKWCSDFFKNENPIVLELGCGKGEYTVNLAKRFPDKNFIGVDLKGARIWYGAKEAQEQGTTNVGFLRTQIELIDKAFGAQEVDEIWITFPDPQIKFKRGKHRLTHPDFLERYRHILKPGGLIHLKTDSEYLHGYTLGLLHFLPVEIVFSNHDIYKTHLDDIPAYVTQIKTHYEGVFSAQGKKITYLSFKFKS